MRLRCSPQGSGGKKRSNGLSLCFLHREKVPYMTGTAGIRHKSRRCLSFPDGSLFGMRDNPPDFQINSIENLFSDDYTVFTMNIFGALNGAKETVLLNHKPELMIRESYAPPCRREGV